MKTVYFTRFILCSALLVFIIAPFTFLVPEKGQHIIPEVTLALIDSPVAPKLPKAVKIIEKPLHKVKLPDFAAIRDIPD